MARNTNLESNGLLWTRAEAKCIFGIDKLWPTFVGAVADPLAREGVAGLMPVMLWAEQLNLLEPKIDNTDKRKKRKLAATEVLNVDTTVLSKRMKVSNPVGIIEHSLYSLYDWTLGWFFGSTPRPSNDSPELNSGSIPITASTPQTIVSKRIKTKGSHRQRVRNQVFSALQQKNYFVGPGDVYGGDYSIYRGDPSVSHSTCTVRVVTHNKIRARDLLSFSRVQNQVAKSAVFAFVPSANNIMSNTTSETQDQEFNIGSLLAQSS